MRVALVTGSGKKGRTGYHIATYLAKKKIQPIIHYHNSSRDARETLSELNNLGISTYSISGDLSDDKNLEKIKKTIARRSGRLDHLVHTVGNYDKDIRKSNLTSSKKIMNALLPLLLESKQARVIFFGAAGLNRLGENSSYQNSYMKCKSDLLIFMRAQARKWISKGLTLNMISPGEMSYSILDREDLPMGRPITPGELSRACYFLLHKDSACITGQNLEVSGGLEL